MSNDQKPTYYVTTPIYYVNAAPHLGTAYTTILADVQARFRRMTGYDVKFLTGLDEHGEKVATSAREHDMQPQEWCDSLVPAFRDLWEKLEITNDIFMRTTKPEHAQSVQQLLTTIKDNGYLYKGSYDGWYCVPEETYFTETQVRHADEQRESEGQHLCPDCGRPLERVQEDTWFFKLSAFEDKLLTFYEQHPEFIEPEIRRNEVVSFVKSGLKDLSISRTSFDWGIPLPFDTDHVTYVWFDALINYLTGIGFSDENSQDEFGRFWPADMHIVGKDITRFHCVIWPAMLMAAGLPLPKRILAHGFLMVKNAETGAAEKMSKSRGNAISPQEIIDLLGVEGYRYYFMSDVVPGADGAISFDRMRQVYNNELANSWGNLVSRTLNMSAKYFEGKTPCVGDEYAQHTSPLKDIADDLFAKYNNAMASYMYPDAISAVMELVHAANHYIEDMEPWALAKDETRKQDLAYVIVDLLEAIRISAYLLAPFMPKTSQEVLRRLGITEQLDGFDALETACAWATSYEARTVEKGDALFPRLQD